MNPISPKYNVVNDIDGVLSCVDAQNKSQKAYFKKRGAIIDVICPHYIFPGVKEYMCALYDEKKFNVSFFSAGSKERNHILIPNLLKLALSKNIIDAALENTKIFSREHLKDDMKDLSVTLEKGIDIHNSIIVDDQFDYVGSSQLRNWLGIKSSGAINLINLENKYDVYNAEGFKSLVCGFTSPNHHLRSRGHIILKKTDEGYKVGYEDLETSVQKEILISDEHKSLIELLDKEHEEIKDLISENDACEINNPQLIKEICNFVHSIGGKYQKICRQANRIFRAAGLLFKALEISESNGNSLTQSLFELQFMHGQNNKINWRKVGDKYYLLGLEKLQKYNSNLKFSSPHDYVNNFVRKAKEIEMEELINPKKRKLTASS